MKKLQKGFTLIELMIVVAIIAILAAVAAPRFAEQLKKSKNAKAVTIIEAWKTANGAYYTDFEEYAPVTLGFGTTSTGLGQYVDAGVHGRTTITAPATATLEGGYASTGTDDTEVTLTYSLVDAEGIITAAGGEMSSLNTEKQWEDLNN